MLLSEMCEKEVISIKDCRKLGHVSDIEFDHCGCICKIMVRPKTCLGNIFSKQDECCIPYKDVKQIGPDIILVNI